MKLGSDLIKKKFDDVEEKVEFLIEFCISLQQENKELAAKNKELEAANNKMGNTNKMFSEQEGTIQTKIDNLLKKLNDFSETNRH